MRLILDYNSSRKQGQILTNKDTLTIIRNHFSVSNPNAKFVKKATGRRIPDRQYAITPTGLFDIGLYAEIGNYIRELQLTDVTFTQEFIEKVKCGFDVDELYTDFKYDLHYYQEDILKKCLKIGRGTVVLGTGGGKSLTQAALIENFWRNRESNNFKCFVIVPGVSLVTQLMQDFEEYQVNFTFGEWTGNTKEIPDSDVIICNSENLTAKFEDNSWILDVDLLMVDECHRTIHGSKLADQCKKIKTVNKFGFTGTLPVKDIDKWKVVGTYGPLLYEKKSKELRDEGFLTDVEVKTVKFIHSDNKKKKYKDELEFIYDSPERNKFIYKIAKKIKNNTLILVNHLKQGHNLLDILSQISDKKVFFIEGKTEIDNREYIKQMMRDNDNVICIAMSRIFATGISINNIHNIFLVGYGKSFIRIVQSIGRGLRLYKTKIKLTIIDLYDNLYYSERHMEERKSFYDMEEIKWSDAEIIL